MGNCSALQFVSEFGGPHPGTGSQAGPEPSFYLTGGPLSLGRASLLFIFIVRAVVGSSTPTSFHLQLGLLRESPEVSGCHSLAPRSWAAAPSLQGLDSQGWEFPIPGCRTPYTDTGLCSKRPLGRNWAQLPSPSVFQRESLNCRNLGRQSWDVFTTQQVFIAHFLVAQSRHGLVWIPHICHLMH